MQRKIRVLVGKPGLDGHDRGAKVVAASLRDAGMEVIYTGLHQTPEQVVEAAIQEDVDVVALSILSGAHLTLFREVMELMRQRGIADRLLTGGGIIPAEDMETLGKLGVGRLFGPGTSTQEIAKYIRGWFVEKHGADSLAPPPGRRDAAASAPGPSAARAAKSKAGGAALRPQAARKPAPAPAPATASPKPAPPAKAGANARPGGAAKSGAGVAKPGAVGAAKRGAVGVAKPSAAGAAKSGAARSRPAAKRGAPARRRATAPPRPARKRR